MKTLSDIYEENPVSYAIKAAQANKNGKRLSIENDTLVFIDFNPPEKQNAATEIRSKRNFLLMQSDWTQGNDSPLSQEEKEKWIVYRQALRDITLQSGFPDNVIFPTRPV